MVAKNLITIKEISKRHNISEGTVRHYINLNLIPLYKREGGKWYFKASRVDARIRKIKKLLGEGFLLRHIREKIK
jgi:excisionase family DNA binding protein